MRYVGWQESPKYARSKLAAVARLREALERIKSDEHREAQLPMVEALQLSLACQEIVLHGEDVREENVVATYLRYGTSYDYCCDSVEEAVSFLAWGEEEGNLTSQGGRIVDTDGRVIEGGELDRLVDEYAARVV